MPKGEHFKKDNPRNYQVSFKVNKSELELLRRLAAEKNQSIPIWLRSHITDEEPTAKPAPIIPVKKKASNKKATKSPSGTSDQTSLF